MEGFFGERGELYFEIDLIATDGSVVTESALLDTGFTDWLALNEQDIEVLGWSRLGKRIMVTARGEEQFNLYTGIVTLDGQELTIPVLGGNRIPEVLLGLQWLNIRRLEVDKRASVLKLSVLD